MSIWFTSDWHFNHDKEFIWKARGFSSVQEMNEEIIQRHNSLVSPIDDVYVLGDLCMGGDSEANQRLIEKMNGKLHIILGNHDIGSRPKMYENCSNVVEIIGYATVIKLKKKFLYISHYPTICGNFDNGPGVFNLCGHAHTTNPLIDIDKGRIFHCELDGNNCYPWLAEDIFLNLENLKEKKE